MARHKWSQDVTELEAVARPNMLALTATIEASIGTLARSSPAGGTTAYPWFTDGRDSRPFAQALAAAGVLIAPGDCFGQPAHMRIGLAQQAEGFGEALRIFGEALGRL